jgi:DnaJ family protein C protein 3
VYCSADNTESDPSSYVNYYKRATAYLSLGKHGAALDDFDSILKLNPEFSQAHYQKAKILAQDGEFDLAVTELRAFLQSNNKKASDEAGAEQLFSNVSGAASNAKHAYTAAKKKKWEECVHSATRALEVGPNSAKLRELRVECNTEMGDAEGAYADLR